MDMNKFVEEMLKEVKDLKDLSKEQVPLVAQEYINYHMAMHLLGIILFGIMFLIGLGLLFVGIFVAKTHDDQFGFELLGGILGGLGFMIMMCNVVDYLKFKLQPRRMAIMAITSLLKGNG